MPTRGGAARASGRGGTAAYNRPRMSLLTYGKYLKLRELLACQELESAKAGRPAHDELLFIVTHQTYELWFKQCLHELDAVLAIMGAEFVNERDVGRALHYLERVIRIQGVLLDQIEVLETMTPLDFLDFRNLLTPSSGLPERAVPAAREQARARAHPAAALQRGRLRDRARCLRAQGSRGRRAGARSLFDVIEAWLARMPFVRSREFDFWREYRANVTRMLDEDRETIERKAQLADAARRAQLEELDRTRATFDSVFDPDRYEGASPAAASGGSPIRRSSPRLMIMLYRDEPILQNPFRLLTALVGDRREPLAMALPARADGPPHDRREDRHRRLERAGLSAPHGRGASRLPRFLQPLNLSHPALAAAGAAGRAARAARVPLECLSITTRCLRSRSATRCTSPRTATTRGRM